MSGITLTPVVATPVAVVADVAANGSQGFGDALGAAMAQFTGNASVADDAALQMADRGLTLADASSDDTEGVASMAPSTPDAYVQLMIAMAQLVNHGHAKEAIAHGAVAPDSSLSDRVGLKSISPRQEIAASVGEGRLPFQIPLPKLSPEIAAGSGEGRFPFRILPLKTSLEIAAYGVGERLPDIASNSLLNEREGLPSAGENTPAVGPNGAGELNPKANFAALLQDLPVEGAKLKAQGQDMAQLAGVVALNHSGVIEVRQQEGRKELIISTPVGSAGWGDELGSKTLVMVRDGQQSAEMQLNPPNLGPLEVRLSVQNDQTSLIFVSVHASVRDAIQSALPRLSGMLAESGLSMGSVQVGDQSLAQQQQQRDGGNTPRRFARSGSGETDGIATVADAMPLQRSSWRLSMFV